jgi:hypothetical protein
MPGSRSKASLVMESSVKKPEPIEFGGHRRLLK